jgi:DNA-binding NtrC family response regulator
MRFPANGSSSTGATEEPSLVEDWPTLAVLTRRYVDRVIAHSQANKTRAAKTLGIDRRTLTRFLARQRGGT